jgi:putative phage-type endonuclease
MIETIHPRDEKHWLELRKQDVTSTETAALFGISPYMTAFELYHRKHDNLNVEFEPNERVKWGSRLQDSIAAGIAEDQKWKIRRMTEYIRDTDLRMGASFDFQFNWGERIPPNRKLSDPPLGVPECVGEIIQHVGILEIKNVDSLAFRDGWIVDGENVEAPPHIEIQVQQQLALSGFKVAYIGALIGGNRVVLIKREPDAKVIEAIRHRIKEFWDSVAKGIEPKPDFSRDADFIGTLFSYAEPGRVITADDKISALATQYRRAADEAKAAEEKKDAARAEILTLIGDAEKVIGPWGTISAGLVGPKHVEYDAKGYRTFRINWKKEKP